MADRMGLDGTMLHYLAVRKATCIVSIHRPVHSKIMLTYSLTWQTNCCTPRRMTFKALLNANTALSYTQVFSALIVRKNCQNGKKKPSYMYCRLLGQLHAWACQKSAYAQLSPLYPSLYPYVPHMINYPRPSPAFLYCKWQKAGWRVGAGNEARTSLHKPHPKVLTEFCLGFIKLCL